MSVLGDSGRGAVAGALATGPMTLLMLGLHRALPGDQKPLPPVEITASLAEKSDIADDLPRGWLAPASLAGHIAYGAAGGTIYGSLAPKMPLGPAASGAIWGLGVWAASYLGYLPALGLYRPVEEDSPQRTAIMVSAHLVWGASLGLAMKWLSPGPKNVPRFGHSSGRGAVGAETNSTKP